MIWVIVVVGLILRLISLDQSLWLDEAINTLAEKNYSLFDLVAQYAKADFHPPGWFILLWFWTKFFGYSEAVVRTPSVIFGVLSIWLTYILGKKLFSKQLGIVAGVLLAINPLHIYYSQEARMYAMATLAVLINIFLIAKLVKGERVNFFYLTAGNLFVFVSDYIAYFIFPAEFLILWLLKKEMLKRWLMGIFIAFLFGIWWLPVFLGQLDVGSVASANLPTWKFVAGAFDFKTIPLTFVKFIIGRISLADKVIYAVVLLPVCSLFALLLYKGIKSAVDPSRKLLLIWLAIPLLIATAISFVIPVYNYFRILFTLPAFLILVAFGTLAFRKRLQYVYLTAVLLVELFCTFVYLFDPAFHREDWKGLVNFLKGQDGVILFESSGTLPPFDYYADGKLNVVGALKDFPAKNDHDVIDITSIEKDVFLIDYLVDISDPQRLVAKKLATSGYKQADIKNFTGVGFVYHYVKE